MANTKEFNLEQLERIKTKLEKKINFGEFQTKDVLRLSGNDDIVFLSETAKQANEVREQAQSIFYEIRTDFDEMFIDEYWLTFIPIQNEYEVCFITHKI